jgi:DNA repair exonuclease SbcCD nuclease subunit
MKIIHLSDLHLGHRCYGIKRRQEFLRSNIYSEHDGGVLSKIFTIKPDLVIVAGDIFDNSSPTYDDLSAFERFLSAARSVCPVIGVTGNHDKLHESMMQVSEYLKIEPWQVRSIPLKVWASNHMYRGDIRGVLSSIDDDLDVIIMHQSMHGFLASIMKPEIDEEISGVLSTKCKYIALGDLHVHKRMRMGHGCIAAYPGTVDFLKIGEAFSDFAMWQVNLAADGVESMESIPVVPLQETIVVKISKKTGYKKAMDLIKENHEMFFVCRAIEDKVLFDQLKSFLKEMKDKNEKFCYNLSSFSETKEEKEKMSQISEDQDFIQIIESSAGIPERDKSIAIDLWKQETVSGIQNVLKNDLSAGEQDEDQ